MPDEEGTEPLTDDSWRTTLEDAIHGRDGSREALQRLMVEHPELPITKQFGDAAVSLERALVKQSSNNVLVQEATSKRIAEIRAELTEPGDTELEAMIVHRIAFCWLAVNQAERDRIAKWKGGLSTEAANFWDGHVSRVQSDFLKACRALATVRKLRRPVVQVNVAEQQINLAG